MNSICLSIGVAVKGFGSGAVTSLRIPWDFIRFRWFVCLFLEWWIWGAGLSSISPSRFGCRWRSSNNKLEFAPLSGPWPPNATVVVYWKQNDLERNLWTSHLGAVYVATTSGSGGRPPITKPFVEFFSGCVFACLSVRWLISVWQNNKYKTYMNCTASVLLGFNGSDANLFEFCTSFGQYWH